MRAVSHHRTTLVIAHRLSTVVDADEIVVLDQGRVAERGTHAALLAHGGLYAHMWAIQAEQQDQPDAPIEDTAEDITEAAVEARTKKPPRKHQRKPPPKLPNSPGGNDADRSNFARTAARRAQSRAGAIVDKAIEHMVGRSRTSGSLAIASALLGGALALLARRVADEAIVQILNNAIGGVRSGDLRRMAR